MHTPQCCRTPCTKSTTRCSIRKCKDLRPAVDQIRFVRISQSRHLAKKPKTTFPPKSNHRSQVRPKLARAPVQSEAHLYAHSETKTVRTTKQRHPAHANPPELIPARPPRPGAAHRGHRHSQTPRESTGAAQQDASGQPNAPMLPQRATTATKCGPFSAPTSPAPPCNQSFIFTHSLRRRRRRRINDIQRTPIRPS